MVRVKKYLKTIDLNHIRMFIPVPKCWLLEWLYRRWLNFPSWGIEQVVVITITLLIIMHMLLILTTYVFLLILTTYVFSGMLQSKVYKKPKKQTIVEEIIKYKIGKSCGQRLIVYSILYTNYKTFFFASAFKCCLFGVFFF